MRPGSCGEMRAERERARRAGGRERMRDTGDTPPVQTMEDHLQIFKTSLL